ncbi:MAG: hypothetical protein D6776_06160 [Planctomycetota bacterium]|nr:MAG: hypothetical protein D6776_06160 [Planctomycetota bacterium]
MRLVLVVLAAASLWGCAGGPEPVELEVEPSGYYVRGYYLGSHRNVKAFVTRLKYVSGMRGSVFVDLAVLNEQRLPIRLELGYSRLKVAEREIVAEDAPAERVGPGELHRARLRFRTFLKRSQMRPGMAMTLELNGITGGDGERIRFRVPLRVKPPGPEPADPGDYEAEGWHEAD